MIVLSNKLIQETDRYIDENHETFSKLGDRFFEVFHSGGNTQVRNLLQITCSATRFADIEDFVKNQMGKEKVDEQNPARWRKLGDEVLDKLKGLREKSQKLDPDNRANQMAVRLRLARGWVRAVVNQYLYKVAQDQMGGSS